MPIKVLIYEDNENLRSSVVAMLQWNGAFIIVDAMPDASDVIADIALLKPDVILMDIDMPYSNGVAAVKAIRTINNDVPVIMFTVFEDNENIFNAICAGANGYLLKKNFEQIPAAIQDVMTGGAPMTSSVAKKVLSFVPKAKATQTPETVTLSKREIEILEYVVKGYSYKMIAAELSVSLETVRSHIKKVYKKLQVNSATAAVYKYTQGK
jgi:DNA-binding NarL/FixJ family response regulator